MIKKHLDPEQIAALADGGLEPPARRSALEALDEDPEALSLLADLQRIQEEQDPVQQGGKPPTRIDPVARPWWRRRDLLGLAAATLIAAASLPFLTKPGPANSATLLTALDSSDQELLATLIDVTAPSESRGGTTPRETVSAVHLGSQCSRLSAFLAVGDSRNAQDVLEAIANESERIDELAPILPTVVRLKQTLEGAESPPAEADRIAHDIEKFLRSEVGGSELDGRMFEIGLTLEAARIAAFLGKEQRRTTSQVIRLLNLDPKGTDSGVSIPQALIEKAQNASSGHEQYEVLTALLERASQPSQGG